MTRRFYWGLAILIILLIGVTVVMLTRTTDTEDKPIVNKYIDREPIKQIKNTGRRDTASVETDKPIAKEPTDQN